MSVIPSSPADLVVEMDSLNNIPQEHMVMTPDSPLYSPGRDSLSLAVFPQSEDRSSPDKYSPSSSSQRDEGIESEEGENDLHLKKIVFFIIISDIDCSVFKQLILQNVAEPKNQILLSHYQTKEETFEKVIFRKYNLGQGWGQL